MKKPGRSFLIFVLYGFSTVASYGQLRSDSLSLFDRTKSPNKIRQISLLSGEAVIFGGTFLGLNNLWYADYPRSGFHTFNDNSNWLQMDKAGHVMTAYYVGNVGKELMQWAGFNDRVSLGWGGSLGLLFLTGVEVLDGLSDEWGFSWGDMAANTAGTIFYIGQELLWQEQKMVLKFSYHNTSYADYAPNLLGNSWNERILKDYNGQTYWLSTNVNSLTGWEKWPAWLNVAAGYGADGMITASYQELLYSQNEDFAWQRQYYFGLDIDLRKIPVKKPWLKTTLKALNFIKIPLPTVGINQNGSVAFYPFYF